jgi:hypothetical protein
MRVTDQQQGHVFSYISPEQRVRKDHSLRAIRAIVDKVLKELRLNRNGLIVDSRVSHGYSRALCRAGNATGNSQHRQDVTTCAASWTASAGTL